MKRNISQADKMIRLLIAVLCAVAVIFELIPEPYNFIGFGISLVLLLTATLNFCPIYQILGINTYKTE